ncbi:MAG: OB-fold nucleic acid binding domain-containing protein [Acidobacteria bacterium]|nr:OB-fold nucleic acid binding domain-containing protein [Acidobacteriota bacterium]
MRRTLTALGFGTLMAVVPVSAHHSFATYYFEDQSVTLEGVVQELQYRSPHAILVFSARDENGRAQTLTAEWSNPRRLSGDGVMKDTLRPGDAVVVSGSPARAGSEHRLHLKKIQRPADGWVWAGGNRGRR